jgi:hypothetical protein
LLGGQVTRPAWPTPDGEELRREIEEYIAITLEERVQRFRFIWQEFGPPVGMLLVGGIPAAFALDELKRTYVDGNFLSCVLLAQTFIEHSLGGMFIFSGNDGLAERGFAALINETRNIGVIDEKLANRLHELRTMRNPYVHPRAGLSERTYMRRIVDRQLDPDALAEADAQDSIRIVVDYLRNDAARSGKPWEPPADTT